MTKSFSSKIVPQSLYRKSSEESIDRIKNLRPLCTDINPFKLSAKNLLTLKKRFSDLSEHIFSEILKEESHPKTDVFMAPIFELLESKLTAKKSSTVEEAITLNHTAVLNLIKLNILEKYTDQLLIYANQKLQYLVFKYSKHLPYHVSQMEGGDLQTIAQLEYIESFKNWDPKKADSIWQLAQFRINGAMKDHIRYITKSDPSRLYEWISDAGHILKHTQESFEQKIETGTQLESAMQELSPRERKVVSLYTQKDQKFKEIANELNISESQASRIYKKAIIKLKGIVSKP